MHSVAACDEAQLCARSVFVLPDVAPGGSSSQGHPAIEAASQLCGGEMERLVGLPVVQDRPAFQPSAVFDTPKGSVTVPGHFGKSAKKYRSKWG
jgi:hypothetical protein